MDARLRVGHHRKAPSRRGGRALALGAVLLLTSTALLVVTASTASAATTCFGTPATIVGTVGADTINGTTGADVIYAGAGNDVVHGRGGNDLICGGDGDDILYGDGGVNKLDGGAGDDNLLGGTTLMGGEGVYDTALFADLPASTPVSANLGAGTARAGGVSYTLSGVEGLVGTPGNDTITGSPGVDLLFGAGGDDVLDGAGGFDYAGFLVAAVNANLATGRATGEGSDVLTNIGGLLASYSPSTLTGNAGPNVLLGAGGNDTLHGGAGDDLLGGGAGSDALFGDGGDDRLLGQGGDDRVTGGAGYDTAAYYTATSGVTVSLATHRTGGSDGVDVLATVENVIGSDYGDTLTGDGGSNWLAGLDGNDILIGGAGNDLLEGGVGSDTGRGGTGSDSCRGVETASSCEAALTSALPAAGTSTQPTDIGRIATALQGYVDRTAYPITCDNEFAAQVHATPPQIYTISGLQEAVTWTPVLFRWDGVSAWQQVVIGDTLSQTAFTTTGSGNAALFLYGYGTMQTTFTINTSGFYRVADYVVWTQYTDTTEYDWAGTHIFDSFDGLFGHSNYDNWCNFPPAGAAAATARQVPPSADAPLPRPLLRQS